LWSPTSNCTKFGVPFDEISSIVGRSPAAARQLASRALRRVQGTSTPPNAGLGRQSEVVDAFLAAARGGDFHALLTRLDPAALLRADATAVPMGAESEARGVQAVAGTSSNRARATLPALINGAAGAAWMHRGHPRVVFAFTIIDGKIIQIDQLADSERLDELDVELLRIRRRGTDTHRGI
jgi:hypothetical protein